MPRTSPRKSASRLGKAIRDYRGGGAFTTWLYAVTMNAARDMMRKTARETVKTEAYRRPCADFGRERRPRAEDPAEALWAAVRQLPDKQRDAVLLVYGEGLEPRGGRRGDGDLGDDGFLAHP